MTRIQPDIQIQLNWQGVIYGVMTAQDLAAAELEKWIGRPWIETVSANDREALDATLEDTRRSGISAFLNVTQCFPSGLELPIEYTTIGRQSGLELLAVGKNLQAVAELQRRLLTMQRNLEREDGHSRELEARYRILFESTSDAILIVRAETLRIMDANPAAQRALGLVEGQDFFVLIAETEHDIVRVLFNQARQQGHAPEASLHLGTHRQSWRIRATLIAMEMDAVFFVHLIPAAQTSLPYLEQNTGVPLEDLLECSPDGFVALDTEGLILVANRAFLELVQVGVRHAVLGVPLGRWLGRPGTDQTILLNTVQRHGGVRLFSTTIRGELGGETEVEISATGGSLAHHAHIGVWFRDVSRRLIAAGEDPRIHQLLDSLAEDIGKTSLRKLIVDTVGVVERHFIEAALRLTGGNRTAAAGLLGLSRQSLYVKLSRYGIESVALDIPPDADD